MPPSRPVMAQRHFVQNPPPTYNQMVSRGLINAGGQVVPGNYILLNLGDYDCVSWTLNDVGGHSLRRCRPRPVRLQLGNRSQPRLAHRPRLGLHVPAQDRQGLLCRMGFRRRLHQSGPAFRQSRALGLSQRRGHLAEALPRLVPHAGLLDQRLAAERLRGLEHHRFGKLPAVQRRRHRRQRRHDPVQQHAGQEWERRPAQSPPARSDHHGQPQRREFRVVSHRPLVSRPASSSSRPTGAAPATTIVFSMPTPSIISCAITWAATTTTAPPG